MLIHIIAIVFSVALLWLSSMDSPFAILHNWSDGELFRLLGIFLFLSCFQYLGKRAKATNALPIMALVAIVLSQFDLAAVAALGLLALTAAVIGKRVSAASQWTERTDIAVHLAIGYAIVLGVLQVAAHFPVNTRGLFTLAVIAVLVLLRRETVSLSADIVDMFRVPFKSEGMAFVLPVGAALCMLVYAALPETHSDALIVNLRMAHQVQVNGMWSFATELNAWEAWPKGSAWLLTVHYLLGGEGGAKLFNWFAIVITSLLVYREANRLGLTSNAWMPVALLLSTPIAFWCGFALFDDAVFGLFVTAAIISAVNSSAKLTPGGVFVTLIFCSAAMATKITGLLVMPVVTAIYIFRVVLERRIDAGVPDRWTLAKYAAACLPLLVIGAFVYVFAYIKTGNPVFPLYNDIFKAGNYPVERFQDLRWSEKLGWDAVYMMASNTSKFMEGRNWTFGIHHALFLIPVMIELYQRRKNTAFLQYGLAITVFTVLVFSQMRYVRYLYPIFPIYAILMTGVLHRVGSGRARLLVIATSILVIAVNLLNVKSLNMYYSFDLKSWSPVETRRFVDYFERSLNQTVNLEYGKSARVLYLHRPYSAGLDGTALNYHWASPTIRASVDGVQNVTNAVQMIRKYGVTHIILDEDVMRSAPTMFTRAIPTVARLQRQQGSAQLWKVNERFVVANEVMKLNDKSAMRYLVKGWREPEPWGTWAYGESAQMAMHALNRRADSPVHVKAFAMPYTPDSRKDGIKVRISVNGYFLREISLRPQQIQQELSFDVPASLVNDDEAISIEYQFPKAFDGSQFQLGFSEISLGYE